MCLRNARRSQRDIVLRQAKATPVPRRLLSPQRLRILFLQGLACITGQSVVKPVFVHIPKTGGHSIVAACGTCVINDSHRPLSYYQSKFGRGISFFSFARNPFDRLASVYFYLLHGGCTRTDRRDRDRYVGNKTFQEFVRSLPQFYLDQQHLLPQIGYVKGCADTTCIGRFETLESDFARFCDRYNIHRFPLMKLNASTHPPYRDLYTKEMAEVVSALYAEDFEYFGYPITLS